VWGVDEGGHAVLIVGWNDADSCWIVKNSWGTNWGETADFTPYSFGAGDGGYFRIKWGQCDFGGYSPFIWDGIAQNNSLDVSVNSLGFSLTAGDSASDVVTIANLGNQPLEYYIIDFEVPVMFHVDDFNSWDGSSWWCGDPDVGGYENHWLQYLDTPVLDLSTSQNPMLTWKGYWNIEDPGGTDPPWDGWDGCNVMISTDGGSTFDVAAPTSPPYDCQHMWAFGHPDQGWDMGENIPGWAGSSNGWRDVSFDLTAYKSNQTVIRFAFASDMLSCTLDDFLSYGFFVDAIQVTDVAAVLFEDDGNDMDVMTRDGMGSRAAPWLETLGGTGMISVGSTEDVEVKIRTEGLDEGVYEGRIQFCTNDTIQHGLTIPVTLEVSSAVNVEEKGSEMPEKYQLLQNYPNPFNGSTRIPFELPERSPVKISVYNPFGQLVRIVVDDMRNAGYYTVEWDGMTENGQPVSSGVYFIRMKTRNGQQSRKVILLK
jgi:hypothetical protein